MKIGFAFNRTSGEVVQVTKSMPAVDEASLSRGVFNGLLAYYIGMFEFMIVIFYGEDQRSIFVRLATNT